MKIKRRMINYNRYQTMMKKMKMMRTINQRIRRIRRRKSLQKNRKKLIRRLQVQELPFLTYLEIFLNPLALSSSPSS